jgi:hypothetical protein
VPLFVVRVSECGFRVMQAGSGPQWNITLPEKYAFLCPSGLWPQIVDSKHT